MLPLSISIIRVATLSRKYLSWVTITTAPFHFSRKSSSQSAILLSRWFVGSSRIRISAGVSSAAHKRQAFFLSPRQLPAFLGKIRHAQTGKHGLCRLSHFPVLLLRTSRRRPPLFFIPSQDAFQYGILRPEFGLLGKEAHTTWLAFVTLPSSGSSSPAIIFSSVDFPRAR